MTTTQMLKSLLIAALMAAGFAQATDNTIQVAMEDGKTVAQFKIGDSNCELIDGQIRCSLGK
jgi:hypothetical protein